MNGLHWNGSHLRSTYGLLIAERPRFDSVPPQSYNTALVYKKPGMLMDPTKRVSAREGSLVGVLSRPTVAATETALDQIKHLFAAGGTLKDITSSGQTRQIEVEVQGEMAVTAAGGRRGTAYRVNIPLLAVDPYWYGISDTTVTLAVAGTSYPTALGTAPSYPVITLVAPTNPTITYRNSSAATVYTLAFTITLTGSDVLTINMAQGTVTKTVSAVTTNALDTLTSGTFPFPLDPNDGVYASSAWPDIKTSSGGATSTVVYRKAYL